MSWKDNKNLGPWKFSEQPDRWGYLNNPRWTKDPKAVAFASKVGLSAGTTAKHAPCGHWHKHKEIAPVQPGNLYGSGWNGDGTLGLESGTSGYSILESVSTEKSFAMVSIGRYHSLALATDGTLWVTGRNTEGQLGLGDNDYRYEWTQVGTSTDWAFIACSRGYTSFAIKTDGSLWSCGQGDGYQDGHADGANKNVWTQIGSDTDWVAVDGGAFHMTALKSDGSIYGSGWNGEGELGYGSGTDELVGLTVLPASGFNIITCCEWGSLGIKTDGTLWATGNNSYGELGLGDYNIYYTFTQVGVSTDWTAVAGGYQHTLALRSPGTLWGAGDNTYGQLGFAAGGVWAVENFTQAGTKDDWAKIFAGYYLSGFIDASGVLYMSGNSGTGEFGIDRYTMETSNPVAIGTKFLTIAAGWHSTLFVKSDGSLYVSGSNRWGELGTGLYYVKEYTLVNNETWKAVEVRDRSFAIKESDGTLWVSGNCSNFSTGLGDYPNTGYLRWRHVQVPVGGGWEQVAIGSYHSVILKNGTIYGCGWQNAGRLARGIASNNYVYEFIQISDKTDWRFIACGNHRTFAIDSDGYLWGCGQNSGSAAGSLGLGDSTDRAYFTQCIGALWKQVSSGS